MAVKRLRSLSVATQLRDGEARFVVLVDGDADRPLYECDDKAEAAKAKLVLELVEKIAASLPPSSWRRDTPT